MDIYIQGPGKRWAMLTGFTPTLRVATSEWPAEVASTVVVILEPVNPIQASRRDHPLIINEVCHDQKP